MGNQKKRAQRQKNKAKSFRATKQNQLDRKNIHLSEDGRIYFGYDKALSVNESNSELPSQGMVCMISEVVEKDLHALHLETGINFKVGEWFVSECMEEGEYKIHDGFIKEDEAMDFGRSLGAVTYCGGPELI